MRREPQLTSIEMVVTGTLVPECANDDSPLMFFRSDDAAATIVVSCGDEPAPVQGAAGGVYIVGLFDSFVHHAMY